MWHPPTMSKFENGQFISSNEDRRDRRAQGGVSVADPKVTDGAMFNDGTVVDGRRSLVDTGINGSLNVIERTGPVTNQSVTSELLVNNPYSQTGTLPMGPTLQENSNGTMRRVKTNEKRSTSSTRIIATSVGCSAGRPTFVSHQLSSRRHPTFKRSGAPRHPRGCLFCKDTKHSAQHCTVYPDADSRIKFLDENQLCHGCVHKRHETKKCPIYNKKKCKICGGKNHILAICRRQQSLTEPATTNSSHGENNLNRSLGIGMRQDDLKETKIDQLDEEHSKKSETLNVYKC